MTPKRNRVSLDADHQGHLACVVCTYLNHIRMNLEECLESDDTDSRTSKLLELIETFYLAGNIEGRILSNNITEADLERVEAWEKEMADDANSNNLDLTLHITGTLPQEDVVNVGRITKTLREAYRKIRPLSHMEITWRLSDLEYTDFIEVMIEVLVNPKYVASVLADVCKACALAEVPITDYFTDDN